MISQNANLAFLKTKPSPERAQYVLKKCTTNSLKSIITEINDDFYLTEMLASFDRFSLVDLNTILENTNDLYLRNLLYSRFQCGIKYSVDEVEQYKKIKDTFQGLKTEEEKTDFLVNLGLSEKTDNRVLKTNNIKISLLQSISEPQNREKVIESMTPQIDSKYKDYVNLAEKMILDFFSKNGNLTQDMKERIMIVFKTYKVEEADLSEEEVSKGSSAGTLGINGDSNHIYRRIRINKDIIYPEEMLNVIIHEYAHAFTHENILKDIPLDEKFFSSEGEELEEGMAETFTETVLNDFLSNHSEITINGKKERVYYPYATGAYDDFVLISKALLYELEGRGEDIEYLQQYFFGDKKAFYDKVQVEEIFKLSSQSNNGVQLNSSKEMIKTLIGRIGDDEHDSKYDKGLKHISFLKIVRDSANSSKSDEDKEKIISLAVKFLQFKENKKDIITRDIDEVFDNRKLDEISKDELDFVGELLPIYYPGNNIMSKKKYIDYKLGQLASERQITLDDARESLKLIEESVSQERGSNQNVGKE